MSQNVTHPDFKNHFTRKDTRFQHIMKLSHSNSHLQNELSSLKRELEKMDEFSIAIERGRALRNNEYNENRINLLKGQIATQQKYIRQLTRMLQLTRQSYSELKCVCEFLMGQYTKIYAEKAGQSESLPNNEGGLNMYLDKKNVAENTQALNVVLKSPEEKERFMVDFNQALLKLLEIEKQNQEYKFCYNIEPLKAGKPNDFHKQVVKFSKPLRQFLDKYSNYINITTIYKLFPTKERDSLNNMLAVIMNLLKKNDQNFKKLRTMDLFKNNPYMFKDAQSKHLDLPYLLLENIEDFQKYYQKREYLKTIIFDYEKLMKAEAILSQLMDALLSHMNKAVVEFSSEKKSEHNHLIDLLRKSIEELLMIGITIGGDSTICSNKILIVSQETILNLQDVQGTSAGKKETQTHLNNSSAVVDRDIELNSDYQNKLKLLEIWLDDLVRAFSEKDEKAVSVLLQKI